MAALAVLPPAEPPRRVRTQRPSGGQEMQIFQLAGQSTGMDRAKKGIFQDWLHVTAKAARPSAVFSSFEIVNSTCGMVIAINSALNHSYDTYSMQNTCKN